MSFCVGLGRLYSKLTTSSGRVQPTVLPNFILAGFGHEPIDFDYQSVRSRMATTDFVPSQIGPNFGDCISDWILDGNWALELARSGYNKWRDKDQLTFPSIAQPT